MEVKYIDQSKRQNRCLVWYYLISMYMDVLWSFNGNYMQCLRHSRQQHVYNGATNAYTKKHKSWTPLAY
jgi:hypothetical protein